jgi:DNA-binding MarR family transcriptional regulator
MNFTKQLGTLAFGTRLRLLTDNFMHDAFKIYKARKIDFEPRWFTTFYLLYKKSPLTISEISEELGYTQPAVTQIADILIRKKLLRVVKHKKDTRKKLLVLSAKGNALIPKLLPVWEAFNSAVKELFTETGYDMMEAIVKLENALAAKDMVSRVIEKISESKSNG